MVKINANNVKLKGNKILSILVIFLLCNKVISPFCDPEYNIGYCTRQYMDLSITRFTDLPWNVPPAINWNLTFDFWYYYGNQPALGNNPFRIYYQYFLNVYVSSNNEVMCVPFEINYPHNGNTYNTIKTNYKNSGAFILEDDTNNINVWTHMRCAYSLDAKRAYLNLLPEQILKIPELYNNRDHSQPFYKRYFGWNDKVTLDITNVPYGITFIMRNLNIFGEYLPIEMTYKYFNWIDLPHYNQFPFLLWTIDFTMASTQEVEWWILLIRHYYIYITVTAKDYSRRSDTSVGYVQETKEFQSYTDPTFAGVGWGFNTIDFTSPFANSMNFYYSCNVPNARFCYDTDKVILCKDHYYYNSNNRCEKFCDDGTYRNPFPDQLVYTSYCNNYCPSGISVCPSGTNFFEVINNFQCNSSTYDTVYYKCYSKNSEELSNSGLLFGPAWNPENITIDLNNSYSNYLLTIWIYPDPYFESVNSWANDDIIFKTNSFEIQYKRNGKSIVNLANGDKLTMIDGNMKMGWHRLVFSIYNTATANIYASLSNLFQIKLKASVTTTPTTLIDQANYLSTLKDSVTPSNNLDLNTIYFEKNNFGNSYYRDLRIFNSGLMNHFSLLFFDHYYNSDTKYDAQLHYFPLTINYIGENYLTDSLDVGKVVSTNINYLPTRYPDYNNALNYGVYFAYEDLIQNKDSSKYYYVNSINKSGIALTFAANQCDSAKHCAYCLNNGGRCLSCLPGYGFLRNECVRYSSDSRFYIYRNPPNNPNSEKLSLNLSDLDISNQRKITIFFYIKIYTFITYQSSTKYKLITFNTINDVYLYYDNTQNNGTIKLNIHNPNNDTDEVYFKIEQMLPEEFGRWIPVSISSYLPSDDNLTNTMVSMTWKYSLLPSLATGFPKIIFEEISFHSTFVGLISDITIYKTFMINPLGFAKWYTDSDNNFKYILKQYLLRSETKDNCITNQEVATGNVQDLGITCVSDYNPYLDNTCSNVDQFYVDQSDVPSCASNSCGKTDENIICFKQLVNNQYRPSSYESCENTSEKFSGMIIALKSGDTMTCSLSNGVNLNRYKPITVNNLSSPATGYSFQIDFWLYNRGYSNTVFQEITVTWDEHIKIKIFNDGSNNYFMQCYAIPYLDDESKDGVPINVSLGNIQGGWKYFTCGVNTTNKLFFANNSNSIANETTYTTTNKISSSSVKLYIEENSPSNYGLTVFDGFRLWNCYSCGTQFYRTEYYKSAATTYLFSNCLHAFEAFVNNQYTIRRYSDSNTGKYGNLVDRTDFDGFNYIASGVGNIGQCNTQNNDYFDVKNNNCNYFFNLNQYKDIVVNEVESSFPEGRYSIGAWIFVEDTKYLTEGITISYSEHVAIHIQPEYNNLDNLVAYCFPRLFLTPMETLTAGDVRTYYNSFITGVDSKTISNPGQHWIYYFCSVNLPEGKFFIMDNEVQTLKPSSVYINNSSKQENNTYYRYFDHPDNSIQSLSILHADDNSTRIFISQIAVFRDYIPREVVLDYFFFKNIKSMFRTSTTPVDGFPPLIFLIDFENYFEWDRNKPYYYKIQDISVPIYLSLGGIKVTKVYTTLPEIYKFRYCSAGEGVDKTTVNNVYTTTLTETCYDISFGNNCDYIADFCLHENTYYYCKNKYLSVVNLTCSNNCPNNYTRQPNPVILNEGYCSYNCGSYGFSSCPNSNANMISQTNYADYSNWTCDDNLNDTQAYLNCVDTNLLKKSTLYFNQYYSFADVIMTFPTSYSEYIFQFWFLVDYLNLNNLDKTVLNYYFIAYPHIFYYDYSDSMFKYKNEQAVVSDNTLPNLKDNILEWSIVTILVKQNTFGTYDIKLYTDYSFEESEISLTNTTNQNLLGIAFCNSIPTNTNTSCTLNGKNYNNIKWGSAWYKDFRIWDPNTVSLYVMQNFNLQYNSYLKSLLSEFLFTMDLVDYENSKIVDNLNISNVFNFNYFETNNDKNNIINYTNYYDYIDKIGETKFIYGISNSDPNDLSRGSTYNTLDCDSYCLRCYSTTNKSCYKCINGYLLIGQTCQKPNGYFLRTPTNNPLVTSFELNSDIDGTPLSDITPITLSMYVKFFGIISHTGPDLSSYMLFSLNSSDSINFSYDYSNKYFIVNLNNQLAYILNYSSSSHASVSFDKNNLIGTWFYISFSYYRSSDILLQKHMFNFQVNNSIIQPESGFNVVNESITFEKIKFNTQVLALFSSIKIYSSFLLGAYGMTIDDSLNTYSLISNFDLHSNSSENCVFDSQLVSPNTYSSLSIACIGDYNEFLLTSMQCDNNHYSDLYSTTGNICNICDSACSFYSNNDSNKITNCYYQTDMTCSCFNDRLGFWPSLRTSDNYYYCDKIESLNYGLYSKLDTTAPAAHNNEFTIEGWFYVYSYIKNHFTEINIVWDAHYRIRIINSSNVVDSNDYLKAQCLPFSYDNDLTQYTSVFLESNEKERNWFYLRCAQIRNNPYNEYYYINDKTPVALDYTQFDYKSYFESVKITGSNNSVLVKFKYYNDNPTPNFGFFFIRELKLFSSYNFEFMDMKYKRYTKGTNLIAYFKNTNTQDNENSLPAVEDVVNEVKSELIAFIGQDLLGYNYVEDFAELLLCSQTQYYDGTNCIDDLQTKCKYSSDGVDTCLECYNEKIYVDANADCVSNCGVGYFGDDLVDFCRSCNYTCKTCSERLGTNCTSCFENYYLLMSNMSCVDNCTEFDLFFSYINQTCTDCKYYYNYNYY